MIVMDSNCRMPSGLSRRRPIRALGKTTWRRELSMFKAFAIVVFLLACVGSASAQYRYGGPRFHGCVAFEHADFAGGQLPIRANSSIGYLSGFWNDRISSLACAPEC